MQESLNSIGMKTAGELKSFIYQTFFHCYKNERRMRIEYKKGVWKRGDFGLNGNLWMIDQIIDQIIYQLNG